MRKSVPVNVALRPTACVVLGRIVGSSVGLGSSSKIGTEEIEGTLLMSRVAGKRVDNVPSSGFSPMLQWPTDEIS